MDRNQSANVPTEENSVIVLHPSDNVAVARVSLSPGQKLLVRGTGLMVRDPIPSGHKIALENIETGKPVIRYGYTIGRATIPIEAGDHVHVHNVSLDQETAAYEFPTSEAEPIEPPEPVPTFLGYPRRDGRAGTRNYIAVVPASNCAAYTAELVARRFPRESLPENVDGVVALSHGHGCGIQFGSDTDQLRRTFSGVIDHPNVAAALLIGLGCEVNQVSYYLDGKVPIGEKLEALVIQEAGGTRATVEEAVRIIGKMIEQAAALQRTETPVSKILLGLECGGSDSFSGITSNPALGHCCDRLVAAGGGAILGETPETFGAEHLLVKRCRSREVAEKYLRLVEQYKQYLRCFGSTFDDNPSPGNKDGGLTNVAEKSLGAVAKAGNTTIMDVVDYAERVRCPGVVFMNTPGVDGISLTGIAAGGANVIAFTTGRGSVNGFPMVPVIKIASNSVTFGRMREDMDINAGRIADGTATVEEIGEEILGFLLRVASGRKTASEQLGHNEFVPWPMGPIL